MVRYIRISPLFYWSKKPGLNDLKAKMIARVGSTDTTNDKQPIILATLRDIGKAKIGMVQSTLF